MPGASLQAEGSLSGLGHEDLASVSHSGFSLLVTRLIGGI